MRTLLLGLFALCVSASAALAGDWFRITHVDTLITARQSDLESFMYLNAHGQRSAVRALYRQLENAGSLFNVQPGTLVQVVAYYRDGTAQIVWGANNEYAGFVNQDDLNRYLVSE